jgi:diguanylate cyclase (GGDEF)-like protein
VRWRFRSKILAVFSGLIAVAQLATIGAVLAATQRAALQRTAGTLQVGAAVLREDLEDQKLELLNWVEVLSRDFGFIEAVATGEHETITSALANHGARVSADLAMLVSLQGAIEASSPPLAGAPDALPFPELLARARADGQAAGITLHRGYPYQVVLMPVYAPVRIAWVCMGFLIDDEIARGLRERTFLDVSFWAERRGGPPRFVASTLPDPDRAQVAAALVRAADSEPRAPAQLAGTDYLTLRLALVEGEQFGVYALLQTSLREALDDYRELRQQLIALALAAFSTAVLIAMLVARSVTRPVQALVAAAQRISKGNYLRPVEAPSDDEMGLLARTFNEMQERIAAREDEILYQASHDPLTGLHSRAVVNERLVAAVAHARRTNGSLAVMLLDLDRFKEINDKLGHKIGDLVLQRVASALRAHTRECDDVMRLGGDEFLVVLEGCDETSARLSAQELCHVLAHAIELDDMHISLELSVGIAVYPEHGSEAEMLLRRSDIALYGAKQSRSAIGVYQIGQDERHLRQLAIIGDISSALQAEQFSLHYQPKVNAKTHEVVQVEALLRWKHPLHGALRADEYIPLAEKSGHIKLITRWVIAAAIEQARIWRERGLHLGIAVNLSAIDLVDEELPELITELLAQNGVPPSSLIIEVTETAVMQHVAQAVRVLERFRAAGLAIALDDFGTGHSSLAQLKAIPVDELKIDKTFILQLKQGSDDEVIVRATIELAHNMELLVIAEGVEDPTTWALLESYGCDLLQGHYISPPLPAAEFERWIEAYYGESMPLSGSRLPGLDDDDGEDSA